MNGNTENTLVAKVKGKVNGETTLKKRPGELKKKEKKSYQLG